MLHPSILAQSAALRLQFETAKPFRHIAVDNFLEAGFCSELVAEFPSFDQARATNELGETGRKAVVSDLPSIGPAYRRLDALIRSRDFLDLVGQITAIDGLLYDPEYVGGGTHENLDGQDLDVHIDFNYHPSRNWHRRLNLILFLNPEWHSEWGGCLELLDDPWSQDADGSRVLTPIMNRAVIFETNERSWHGFRRIQLPEERKGLSRRSIAVYYYTRERPAAETEVSHGTVYVPRPLPEHLTPGYTLTAEDVHELEILTNRRDAQIRFLHERELEFSDALEKVRHSLSFRVGRALTWPLRRLRSGLAGRSF